MGKLRGITVLATVGTILGLGLTFSSAAIAVSDTSQFSVTPGTLAFVTNPDVPNFAAVTLTGQSQTGNATMNNFSVDDATGSAAGWHVTVNGDSTAGKSPVFAQYCPNATCGPDSGPGYVTSGASLAADSLTLNSTGASFTGLNGSTGTAPTQSCNAGCFVDVPSASPTVVAAAATSAGMGTWATTGFSGTSLALALPTTLKALNTNEVYHLDLVWTLVSGP